MQKLELDIQKLKATFRKKKAASPKYLPGETRAACGPDGFQDLSPRARANAIRSSLYSDNEPRNIVPPQSLDPMGEITSARKKRSALESKENVIAARCITDYSTTHHLEDALRESKRFLTRSKREVSTLRSRCLTEEYIINFQQRLLEAEYKSWSVEGWHWSEATIGAFPKAVWV